MKRCRWLLAVCSVSAVLAAQVAGQAPGQLPAVGPGSQGSTVRNPWDEQGVPATPGSPAFAQPLLGLTATSPTAAAAHESRYPVDYNRDIEVNPTVGPWMVSVTAYTGPEAPRMARQMVNDLRAKYRLPAYVFNFGAEERQKEAARIKARVDKHRELLEKTRQQFGEQATYFSKINVPTIRIQDNCAVLVGGYRDDDSAHAVLKDMRSLDPSKLDSTLLERKFYGQQNPNSQKIETVKDRAGKDIGGEYLLVNPFQRAFVVRNPTVKQERPAEKDQMDIDVLRRLNSDESLSLLRCPKNYTLAIKQFQTPTVTQDRNEPKVSGVLGTLGLGKTQNDAAAENAHNLAEALRKGKLEAYVLHTRFASVVTIGGFDSPDDPNLRSMQRLLESRLQLAAVQVMPPYGAMKIPH